MTGGPDKKSVEHLLALYIDNELAPQERAEFERMMDADPSLRAEVELQHRIDAVLRSSFDPSHIEKMADVKPVASSAGRYHKLRRVAAILFFVVSIGVAYWQIRNEFGPRKAANDPYPPYTSDARSMLAYYDEAISKGFEPGWVCSGEQFESTFRDRFGQRIVLDNLPSNVKIAGLGYAKTPTLQTVTVYAQVDGKPVLLFVDSASAVGDLNPMSESVFRHERMMGRLLIYEVSQFPTPQILDYISVVKCKRHKGE